jgi:hypothetical protein
MGDREVFRVPRAIAKLNPRVRRQVHRPTAVRQQRHWTSRAARQLGRRRVRRGRVASAVQHRRHHHRRINHVRSLACRQQLAHIAGGVLGERLHHTAESGSWSDLVASRGRSSKASSSAKARPDSPTVNENMPLGRRWSKPRRTSRSHRHRTHRRSPLHRSWKSTCRPILSKGRRSDSVGSDAAVAVSAEVGDPLADGRLDSLRCTADGLDAESFSRSRAPLAVWAIAAGAGVLLSGRAARRATMEAARTKIGVAPDRRI